MNIGKIAFIVSGITSILFALTGFLFIKYSLGAGLILIMLSALWGIIVILISITTITMRILDRLPEKKKKK